MIFKKLDDIGEVRSRLWVYTSVGILVMCSMEID